METLEPFDNIKNNNNDLKRTNTDFKQTNTDNTLDQNLSILQDKFNELEKRIKKAENNTPSIDLTSLENDIDELQTSTATNENNITNLQQNVNSYDNRITTNANNISNLQTTVSGYNTTINSLQSTVNGFSGSINTNTNNITTNTNNISSLTTSVNSCIQAINEINNGAELPSPLFTIDGISFGTPVYSVYDHYETDHYFKLLNENYNRSVWFICEPYCQVRLKINVDFEVQTKQKPRNFYIAINGEIMKNIAYTETTQGTFSIKTELSFYPISKSNEIKVYLNTIYSECNLYSSFEIFGKNVCFLNSKRKINFSPTIDDTYIFTRTYNHYPQIQIATFENLDFDNGWQYVPNYTSFKGGNFHYFKTYDYDSSTNTYTQNSEYLFYQRSYYNEQFFIMYKDFNASRMYTISNNVSPKNAISLFLYATSNNTSNLCVFFGNAQKGINNCFRSKLQENSSSVHTVSRNIAEVSSNLEIIDTFNVLSLKKAFCETHPIYQVQIDYRGFAYLYNYANGNGYYTKIDFGTQPYAYMDDSDDSIIYIYLNKFGTIFRYTYQCNNNGNTFISKQLVTTGDYLYQGYDNHYFVQLNDRIKKV